MKLRNLDLVDSKINRYHEAMALPPIEKQTLSPLLQFSVALIILTLCLLVIAGAVNLFWSSFDTGINSVKSVLANPVFWTAIAIGLFAQTVDGALGMAYGVTSNSFLLATGVPPALATASVHMAEVFTTGASGIAHVKLGNVDKQLFLRLLVPGCIGVIIGALVVTNLDASVLKPVISVYLLIMGIYILVKAKLNRQLSANSPPRHIAKLAMLGGFVDTTGGGGWGPVVTTTLLSSGHNPRTTIGTVNFAEFFLTVISASSLFILVEGSIWPVVTGLIIGGFFAAPFAALACKHIPVRALLVIVGTLISTLSVISLSKLFL